MPVRTLDALVLLGWMERTEAVDYLTRHCVCDPPLSEADAERLWEDYRHRVESLPERNPIRPALLPIPAAAEHLIVELLKTNPTISRDRVIHIDPMGLLTLQSYVVLNIANEHGKVENTLGRFRRSLLGPGDTRLSIRGEQQSFHIDVPHWEFVFRMTDVNGTFRVLQAGRYVGVAPIGSQFVLVGGYHRCFGWIAKSPEARENRTLLAVLQNKPPPQLLDGAPKAELRQWLLGPRPPMMADFLDPHLALPVRVREKRYEMVIKAEMRQVDVTDD